MRRIGIDGMVISVRNVIVLNKESITKKEVALKKASSLKSFKR